MGKISEEEKAEKREEARYEQEKDRKKKELMHLASCKVNDLAKLVAGANNTTIASYYLSDIFSNLGITTVGAYVGQIQRGAKPTSKNKTYILARAILGKATEDTYPGFIEYCKRRKEEGDGRVAEASKKGLAKKREKIKEAKVTTKIAGGRIKVSSEPNAALIMSVCLSDMDENDKLEVISLIINAL